MSAFYEFLTINCNKRRGPFLIRHMGVPIGMARTRRKAMAAVTRSEKFVTQKLAEIAAKVSRGGRHD